MKFNNSKIAKVDECGLYWRVAKITPKKIGEFVTFYDRHNNTNHPILEDYDFNYLIVNSGGDDNYFIFPKSVLITKGIVETSLRKGKMAFRVYPDNSIPIAAQAKSSQNWQLQYYYKGLTIDQVLEIVKKNETI